VKIHAICCQTQIQKYLLSIRFTREYACMCVWFELGEKKLVNTRRLWEGLKTLDICTKLTWRTLRHPFHCCSERSISSMFSRHAGMHEQAALPSPSNRFSLPKCHAGVHYNRGARRPFLASQLSGNLMLHPHVGHVVTTLCHLNKP